MAKRKTKKKGSKGLLYLILLACAAFVGYGPLSNAWQTRLIGSDRLPQSIQSALQTDKPQVQTSAVQGLESPPR